MPPPCLPSYTVDVWISGSDEAGNPYDTISNSMNDPSHRGPWRWLDHALTCKMRPTTLQWDVPSPFEGETAKMVVNANNLGGNGNVTFALQELVDGGFWATVSAVEVQATTGATSLSVSLPVVANAPAGSSIDHTVVLVDGVEMDRRSVDSLLVKQETIRDGEALSEQLSTDVFSVSLFIIALGSVSFALYAMVLRRRMLAPETEEALADQTEVVTEDMNASKPVPELGCRPAPGQPADSSASLCGGSRPYSACTVATDRFARWLDDEQWNSYGWQYIDALSKQ